MVNAGFRSAKTIGALLVVLGYWALPANATALPLCGGGVDVMSYNAGGGCEVDGLVFSNFSVVDAGNPGVELVNAVASAVIDGTVYFQFNPNLSGPGDQDIHFFFKVATMSGSPSIVGVDLFNGGVGNTMISEALCTTAWVLGTCGVVGPGSVIGTGLVANSLQFDQEFFTGVSAAWIFKDIAKAGDGNSHLTSFTQSFHVPDGGSTLALLGFGMLTIPLLRSRYRRR